MAEYKYRMGEVYFKDPEGIKFDEKFTRFNRLHNEVEYLTTKLSIESTYQIKPISINSKTGDCEDGRHRVRICKELGIDVKCQDIDGTIPETERILFYNSDSFSGRKENTAQKAIQALKLATDYGIPQNKAANMVGVGKEHVNYAAGIAGLKRYDVLETITERGAWKIPDRDIASKNLRTIHAYLKAESEKDQVEEHKPKGVHVDYLSDILTDRGRDYFLKIDALTARNDHERRCALVELVNYMYTRKINSITGEITEEDVVLKKVEDEINKLEELEDE